MRKPDLKTTAYLLAVATMAAVVGWLGFAKGVPAVWLISWLLEIGLLALAPGWPAAGLAAYVAMQYAVRVRVHKTRKMHHLDRVQRLGAAFIGGHSAYLEAEFDIVEYRQPGKERRFLEHHQTVARGAFDEFGVDEHLA